MSDASAEFKAKGNKAFAEGKFEEAIEHFTKAIEANPNDHVFYSNRSAAYASLEKYEEALDDGTKCVSMKPDWGKGYQRKGLAEFYLGKLPEAETTYKKGLELDPNNQLLKEGLERVVEEKEGGGMGGAAGMDSNTQAMLGKLLTNPKTAGYFKDPDFISKLQMIQKNPQMIGMFMNDPKIKDAFEVLLGGGGFNFGTGGGAPGGGGFNFGAPGGEEEFKAPEHQHGPGCSHDHGGHDHGSHDHGSHGHSHGGEKMEEEKPKPAPQREKAPPTPTNESERLKNLGNDEYKKRNFEKAIEYYDQAFKADPTEYIILNNKAAAYLEMGKAEECIKYCDEALEVSKGQPINYTKLGKVLARKASAYAHIEDYDHAIEWYGKSLLEDANQKTKDELKKIEKLKKDKEAQKYIDPTKAEEHRVKGNEFFTAAKYPDAIKEYEEGLRRDPKSAKLYANRGTAYMKLMEYPSALRDFDKCLDLDPKYVKAYAKKGVAQRFLKEYHKSVATLEQGLKLEPENAECQDELRKTKEAIMMGQYSETKEEAADRQRHAMADPEIQAIIKDPLIHTLLQDLQNNPRDPNVMKALKDPNIAAKLEKLIGAGVLKTQ
jgi:stress-induced-phosphoprotein 1